MVLISARRNTVFVALFYNFILQWCLLETHAQRVLDCGSHYLQSGETVVIGSSTAYYGARVCKWTFTGPSQSTMNIRCSVTMPQNTNCGYRLVVSITGNDQLSDGYNYCGRNDFILNLQRNVLTVGLSTMTGQNYWYSCQITAVPTATTTTPKPSCDCGWSKRNRIVNGVETIVYEFPFMAAMIRNGRAGVACGAALISNRFALTAGHCVYQQQMQDYSLRVGAHNMAANSGTRGTDYALAGFILHENYNPTTFANDIAILVTVYSIPFSIDVGPACLPYRYTDLDLTYAPVTCMGWGTQFASGPQSNTLQKIDLYVISTNDCRQRYPSIPMGNWTMCTYDPQKDACQFDSGGPCVWFDTENTRRQQLFGIISQGKGCGENSAGINSKVGAFVNWIFLKTGKQNYCLL